MSGGGCSKVIETGIILDIKKNLYVQQGLEIRGFWFQKKTVQLKTVLREVYTYVLNEIFFTKKRVSSRLLFKIRAS